MDLRPRHTYRLALACLLVFGSLVSTKADDLVPNNRRATPIVQAVASSNLSVVNIRGRKTISVDSSESSKGLKQVNGMGTGIVIDSRGYILTNYHVVDGVKTIHVTTADRQTTTAQLLAHDPETDLAVLKISVGKPLPPIRVGTSSDLMLAEQVIAIGNAYGYEHTVTVGIISSLSRTVQVNDEQIYRNLIQTDAAINPGNSGGPLLNINGEMIGINVAVRIGAQGIAFAIPVNDAIEVAADLMEEVTEEKLFHGMRLVTRHVNHRSHLKVVDVTRNSPADKLGVKPGDLIESANGKRVTSRLDFQTALLDSNQTKKLSLETNRSGEQTQVELALATRKLTKAPVVSASSLAWEPLGLKLLPASEAELRNRHPNYTKGLRVVSVRSNSPAEAEGIMAGDILVAMHGWKTESLENLAYVLQLPDVNKQKQFMFYILRDKEPFWGKMRVARLPR